MINQSLWELIIKLKKTQISKNQKVIKSNNKDLEGKDYLKNNNQPNIQQPKFKPLNSRRGKRKNWLDFDKCYF